MNTASEQRDVLADTLPIEQRFQDQLIGNRLPGWLLEANHEQLDVLGAALRQSLLCRQALSALMAQLEGIDSFTTTALEDALEQHFGERFSLSQWRFIGGHREPVINAQPVGAHLTELVYSETPLLEAAMRGFSEEQAAPGGQPRGNRLLSSRQGTIKPPTAIEFAKLCREVDVGRRYQEHLDSVLLATNASGQTAALLIADGQRQAMLIDAYRARFDDVLNEAELQLIIGLCTQGELGRLDGAPVIAKQLRLLGCDIQQVVVLDVIDEGLLRNTTQRALLYVPGDPNGPWSVFTTLRKLANGVGKRLRTASYQRYFSRFIRRRDSQQFFATVLPGYADLALWANIDLDEHLQAWPQPLFPSLGQARIAQIKDDAAMLAVPVADLDRDIQQAHDQRLVAEGWALLNIAGFFIPGVGAALLAMTAWELLGEVYHGVEAWHQGDTNEAFDHLLHVATDLAVLAATAAGAAAVSRAWNRSLQVDNLVPAALEDGTTKLCNQDLAAFRGEGPPAQAIADAQGVLRLGERSWVEVDGVHYPAVQQAADGQWRLRNVAGYAPRLLHNGAGAWRLWYEQPAQWAQPRYLFRRLGASYRALDDEQIDQVLLAHDLSADQLRALHVQGHAPEPAVLDTVQRLRLDQRIRDLVSGLRGGMPGDDTTVLQQARLLPGAAQRDDQELAELIWRDRRQLFQRIYDSSQPSATAETQVLRRQFPSLHEGAAQALLRGATLADRQRLSDSARVSLALAQAARASVLRIRLARVYEAFYLDIPQPADLARACLAMLEHLPGAAGTRWRLFEGDADGPLLLSRGAGEQGFDLVHSNGQFQLLDAQGEKVGELAPLFDAMAPGFTMGQRDAMGIADPFAHNLRVTLGRLAAHRRQALAELFSAAQPNGWLRLPQRLPEGRIGYPLSGRGAAGFNTRGRRPTALIAMVRALYPTLTDAQILAWLNDLQHAGRDVHAEIGRLGRELETLDSSLYLWSRQPADARLREERQFFRESLTNCWQRRTTIGANPDNSTVNYRFAIFAAAPGNLPEIPVSVSFSHVFELALLGMNLTELPSEFLRAFSNLRILELSGNRLRRIPANIGQLEHLRELDLFNNQIVLDPGQAALLENCESIEYLNLSFNPLGRGFSLRELPRLRRLHMRNTRITELPAGVLECPDLLFADLRDNRISALPARFHRAPLWARRMVMLWGNPLRAEDLQRLPALVPAVAENPAAPARLSVRQRWLDVVENLARDELSSIWEAVETEPGAGDFFHVLERLLGTAEFQHHSAALADRVFALLQLMRDYSDLREALFNQVNQQLTCQDSVTLCFSNLELRTLVWRAQRDAGAGGQQGAFLNLGRQLWRLDQVDRIALEDIQARRADNGNPDEIEVSLAYRLALRDSLNLPAQPTDMMFAPVAGVDPARIDQARAEVQRLETNEQVGASLTQREFWQEYLETRHRARFDAIDAPFHDRLHALLEGAEAVPEVEYLARVTTVNEERRAAHDALLLELTLQALQAPPPGSNN